MISETLKDVDDTYSLDELRSISNVIELDSNCWLCIQETDSYGWVHFFCGSFARSDGTCDHPTNIRVTKVFEGCGPSIHLRQCRHIVWGDRNGYTFYLPADAVIAALTHLKQYFDFN